MRRSRSTVKRGSGRTVDAQNRKRSHSRPRELIGVIRFSAEARGSRLAGIHVLFDDPKAVLLRELAGVLHELFGAPRVAIGVPRAEHLGVVARREPEP